LKPSIPVVAVVCDRVIAPDGSVDQSSGEPYVRAVSEAVGAMPLLVPALDPPLAVADVLAVADGFLFSGAISNVAPHRYGADAVPGQLHDEARDTSALPLIRAASAAGKPLFCICRGFQELNVALGGSLHQAVHDVPGLHDHREKAGAPLDVQFAPVHEVCAVPGGWLDRVVPASRFRVNSLHWQGIDRLADGLVAEAFAPDGLIEAVSLSRGYAVGVQWHPEWRWAESPVSRALFATFADAVAASTRGPSSVADMVH
jgi:putative glutamine amidotransferase